MPYPKFNRLDVIWDLPENCEEWDYVLAILLRLESHLIDLRLTENCVFFITAQSEIELDNISEPIIVYQIGDKTHQESKYTNDVFMVFKNFSPINAGQENIFDIPLGYNSNVPRLPFKPISDRSIDISFMGNSENRETFFSELGHKLLEKKTKKNLRIENNSDKNSETYAQNIANARIAICSSDDGHKAFCIYEAMRSGCAVLAPRQLLTWYTNGWPVVELDNWDDVEILVDDILNDESRLREISNKTRAWWEQYCSEEAVARYMAREISIKLMKKEF